MRLGSVVILALMLVAAVAGGAEAYLVVAIEGIDGEVTHEVLTRGQYEALLDEIREERRYHDRALTEAKRLWREDTTLRRPFPSTAIGRRAAGVVGTMYADREDAQRRKRAIETRVQRRQQFATELASDRRGELHGGSRRRNPSTIVDNPIERERERLAHRARELYATQLRLMVERAGQASSADAEPEAHPPIRIFGGGEADAVVDDAGGIRVFD